MSSKASRQHDQAYVLHSRSFRNTSLIVEIFTREHGKFSVVARGARQNKSSFYSLLQPFAQLLMQWGGGGEMPTLYSAELNNRPSSLLNRQIYSGFYLNELLMHLLHRHDPHPALFDIYRQTLEKIRQDEHVDVALRYFELDLLEQLGYGINLQDDTVTGKRVIDDERYTYLIEQGPARSLDRDEQGMLVSGKTLRLMSERSLAGQTERKEAKLLLRSILDHYLGHKPLKTRELLQSRNRVITSTKQGN
jgi:DNA repair protein RecO (recombination protein O)